MKICFIAPKNFPVPALKGGAVETLITDFIDENEKSKKVDVDVITIYDKEAFAQSKKYCNTNFLTFKFVTGFLFKILDFFKFKQDSFDTKSINKIKAILYEKRIAHVLKKKKYDFVITEGGHYWEYKSAYKYVPIEKSIFHIHNITEGNVFLERNYGNFIGTSKFINNKFVENKVISNERVHLLYNGVKIENFNKDVSLQEKKKLREKYGLKENEKTIIYCGRLVKGKGVKEVILAFKKIYRSCNAKLLIVGSPDFSIESNTDYRNELIETSKQLENYIIFTGHIYNKDLYRLYSIANIAVFPHNCDEAFGLAIVEAMSSGVPVITTNDGGIPEVIQDTDTIVLDKNSPTLVKDIAGAILKIIDNDKVLVQMSNKGKQKARLFSTKRYYENYVAILNKLNNKYV